MNTTTTITKPDLCTSCGAPIRITDECRCSD
jgi:hypothetical protein